MTDKMIAYCGLVCSKCPAFLATLNDDDGARKKTSEYYADKYGLDIPPEGINCDGCRSRVGRLISFCAACDVRKCGQKRNISHCGECEDQPCDKLNRFHEFSPDAKRAFQALLK